MLHSRRSSLFAGLALMATLSTTSCSRPRSGATVGCFQMGEQIRSNLDMSLAVSMSRSPNKQQMRLTGELTATPVDSHDGVVEVAYQIERPQIHLQGNDAAPAAELQQAELDFATGLGRRFYVRHRPDGAALAISFDRGYEVSLANVLRTLVGMSQLVQSPGAAWTLVEQDANGQYLASYARGEGGRISKRKLRYIVQADATSANNQKTDTIPVPQLREGTYDLTPDARGRVRELQAKERVSIALAAAHLSVETEAELRLNQSTQVMASALIGDYERRKSQILTQPLQGTSADPVVQRGFEDRRVLGKSSFDDVWAEVLARPDPTKSADNADTVRRLEAVFRLQETTLSEALKRLPGIPEAYAKMVIDALSLARTDAAQDALAAVAADERLAPTPRLYGIRYLAHQDHPTSATLAKLEGLLDDADLERRQTARLAFGTVTSKLGPQQIQRAESMVRALAERLARAANDNDRCDLYLALGNTASPLAFDVLQQATKEGRPLLRGTALQAIGRINDPRAVAVLEQALHAPEEPLRMAALNGMGRRELGPLLPALVKAAQNDESPYVRSASVELLSTALDATPQLRPVLAERATKDKDARVRAAAARALDPTQARDL